MSEVKGSITNLLILINLIVFLITVITANLASVTLILGENRTIVYRASPAEVLLGGSSDPSRFTISWLQFYLSQINFFVIHYYFLWQPLTSMFVHFGIVHLSFNMLALYFLGNAVEVNFGKKKYLLIYLLSGITGNIASLFLLKYLPLVGGIADFTPSAGASGAIFGLLGAIASLGKKSGNLASSLAFALIIFLVNSFLPGVNIFAHLFGLLAGFTIAYIILSVSKERSEFFHPLS